MPGSSSDPVRLEGDTSLAAVLRQQAALEIHHLAHALRDENQNRLWRFVERVTRRLSDDDVMDVVVEEFLLELKADRVGYVAADESDEGLTFAVSHEAAEKGVKRLPLPYVIDPVPSDDFHDLLASALRHAGPEVRAWSNPVKIQPEPRFEEELREEFHAALEEEFGLASFVSCHSAMACSVDSSSGGKALFHVQRVQNREPWTRFQRELFGEMCRYAASLLDQTRLSEEVRDLQDQFSSLIASMPSAIVGMDLLGTVSMWNQKAEEIFGVAESDALGRVFWDIVPEFASVEAGLGRILQMDPGASLDFELQLYRRSDGKRLYLRPSLFTLFGSDRGEVAVRIDDVTGAEELRQKLSLSQRRELQGAWLEASARELQDLLIAAQGRMWLLEQSQGVSETPAAKTDFSELKTLTEKATTALGRILGFTGEVATGRTHFEFRQVVQDTVDLCRKTFGPAISVLHRDEAESSTLVDANRHQLEQAVLNLFLHAGASIRRGGAIVSQLRSSLAAGANPGPWVQLHVEVKGGETAAPISDPGASSLGWTVARALTEECGGKAEATPISEMISHYHLAFPLAAESPADASDAVAPPGHGTLLFVHAQAPWRETAQRVFQTLGYTVAVCADGASAVRYLESGATLDAVVVDWDLPVLSGRDSAAIFHAMRPDLKILFVGVPAKAALTGLPEGSALLPRSHRLRDLAKAVRDAVADLYLRHGTR